jgi:hypothetical protein
MITPDMIASASLGLILTILAIGLVIAANRG